MPFASINLTNPRTNPWNFGDVEKLSFFESAILIFFFQKKKFFLPHSYLNSSQINEYQGLSAKNYLEGYKVMRNTVTCSILTVDVRHNHNGLKLFLKVEASFKSTMCYDHTGTCICYGLHKKSQNWIKLKNKTYVHFCTNNTESCICYDHNTWLI